MKIKAYKNDSLVTWVPIITTGLYILFSGLNNGFEQLVTAKFILKAGILCWITFIISIYLFAEKSDKKANINSMMEDIGF